MHPVDGRLGVARRLHRKDVVVLVLEVAGLVRPQTSERGRDRRRLQTDGRNGVEIHGVGHDVPPNAPTYVRLRRPEAISAVKLAERHLGTADLVDDALTVLAQSGAKS